MTTASLLLAVTLAPQAATGSATDYFPMNPGDEYTYSDESGRERWSVLDRVVGQVTLGETQAMQVDSYLGGKVFGSTFYQVAGSEVLVIAYDKDKPMANPFPVFKMPGRDSQWEVETITKMVTDEIAIKIRGASKAIKPVRVLGKEREAVQVTLNVDDGTIKTEQVSTYAKGIGLVEMIETVKINKTTQKRARRLVSYKPAP